MTSMTCGRSQLRPEPLSHPATKALSQTLLVLWGRFLVLPRVGLINHRLSGDPS